MARAASRRSNGRKNANASAPTSKRVYYVPIGVTDFQKDLIEILVSLHSKSFIQEYDPESVPKLMSLVSKPDEGITSSATENTPSDCSRGPTPSPQYNGYGNFHNFTPRQMTYTFLTAIRAVANHPCLLVDHYMPRQFLRMEPTERLINSSDKFRVLQDILYSLMNRANTKTNTPLRIALVSHNIKELDLLEGLVLGQNFKLKRLSGRPLYDERHVYVPRNKIGQDVKGQSSERDRSNGQNGTISSSNSNSNTGNSNNLSSSSLSLSSSPSASSSTRDSTPLRKQRSSASLSPSGTSFKTGSTPTYSGYPRDNYNYTQHRHYRQKRRRLNADMRNWLFLATTTHLMHEETLLQQYDIDIVISFDPMLNVELPALELLKGVPIVMLLVRDTPDHYLLVSQAEKREAEKREAEKVTSASRSGRNGRTSKGQSRSSSSANSGNNGGDVKSKINTIDPEKEYSMIKEALFQFLKRRNRMSCHSKEGIDFNSFFDSVFSGGKDVASYLKLTWDDDDNDNDNNEDNLRYLLPVFTPLTHVESKIEISLDDFNVKSYQIELMRRTLRRLDDVEYCSTKNKELISEFRKTETVRQNQLDYLKFQLGKMFKKIEDLKTDKLDSEKRVDSLNAEWDKLGERYNYLSLKLEELRRVLSIADTAEVEQYEGFVQEKTKQLGKLTELNNLQSQKLDDLKEKYQLESSRASQSNKVLESLRRERDICKRENCNIIGPEIDNKGVKALEEDLKLKLKSLKARNLFLQNYMDSIASNYQLPDSAVSGSNLKNESNSSGGQLLTTGRHRNTRSSAFAHV